MKNDLKEKKIDKNLIDSEEDIITTQCFNKLTTKGRPKYKLNKGQEAVAKLMKEKRGYIKGAFNRKDFGEIDLLWGNEALGLMHIIQRREKDKNVNVNEFLSNIAEVIEKGEYVGKTKNGTFKIFYSNKVAIISPEYHNHKISFLLTAFKTHSKKIKA